LEGGASCRLDEALGYPAIRRRCHNLPGAVKENPRPDRKIARRRLYPRTHAYA